VSTFNKGDTVWTINNNRIHECKVIDVTPIEVILAAADTFIDGTKTGEIMILRRRPELVDKDKSKVVERATVTLPEDKEVSTTPSLLDFE